MVHALLSRLPEIAPDARGALAVKYARAQGFSAEDAAALADETLRILNDPEFAAGLRAHPAAPKWRSWPICRELGPGAQVNGRVDRLAVTDTEVLILDFKTNRPPPTREEDVSPLYLAQMALYRAAAARIFPGKRIVCGLVWTGRPVPDAAVGCRPGRAIGPDNAPP